ncbi:fibronectin type III domain-containing protein [Hymenobacter chitinivorans]|uniref:Fibronectin type-III domain-containing protein n=1 Tax=Hymenobacter chitinivorans DSM 11115 TaxID=1121954 RepID=A0A2M9BS34_9BACT|nr:fibronectin type III domain-containing protein [Hymenobacter chitinivorans]PJJ60748.1 hypothetical protein CLV45_2179 [Hymenobacter chitinivorans DSM 11115]
MKTVSLLTLLLGSATCVCAQAPVTLLAARAAGPGATVTIRGTVSNGPELGGLRYVQDKDAGLAAYSLNAPGFSSLVLGDSVELRGTLKNYNGLLEMDPISSVKVLAKNRRLIVAEVPAADLTKVFAEAYEGRLVKLKGVNTITTLNGSPLAAMNANSNYLINGQKGAQIRINSASNGDAGLVGKPVPTGDFDLVGVVSQFAPSGTGGYQVLPRLYTDFVLGGGLPNITGEPVPTEMSRTGFTVSFTTQNPGDTRVEYGKTSALGTVVANATQTTKHNIALTDLQPGTVYYVKVTSTNAVGKSESPAVPMITDTKKRATTRTRTDGAE